MMNYRHLIVLLLLILLLSPGCSAIREKMIASSIDAPIEKPLNKIVFAEKPSPPALGQQPPQELEHPKEESSAEAKQAGKKEGTPLSLYDAVRLAIVGNRDIQVSSYSPPQALADLKSAESVYDPALFERSSISQVERPTEGFLDNGLSTRGVLREHRWNVQVGVKEDLPTGANLALYYEMNRLNSSSTLVLPNPQNSSKLTAEIKQPVLRDFGGQTNRTAIKVANLNVAISNGQFRQKVDEIIEKVIGAYWQLYYSQSYLATERELLTRAQELLAREETRKEKGISKQLDVDRVNARVQTLESSVFQAYNQVFNFTKQLKLALGSTKEALKIGKNINPTDQPTEEIFPFDLDALEEKALQERPEVKVAVKSVEVAAIKKKLANHQKLPKLDAKVSYSYNGLGENFSEANDQTFFSQENTWSVGVEFEYPLGNRKASAEYLKNLLEHEKAKTNLYLIQEQIKQEISLALAEVELAGKEVRIAKKSLKANNRILKSETVRYALAQVTNENLLDIMESYADSKKNYSRALVNYNVKLMDLKKVQGALLHDYGVELASDK